MTPTSSALGTRANPWGPGVASREMSTMTPPKKTKPATAPGTAFDTSGVCSTPATIESVWPAGVVMASEKFAEGARQRRHRLPHRARRFCSVARPADFYRVGMEATRETATVGDFMTRELCTADADLPLSDAQQRMDLNNIRHLAVVADGKLIGVVSNRDIGLIAGATGLDAQRSAVRVAVTGPAQACAPQAPVSEVAKVMEAKRLGSVVVVEDGTAIGIFTTTDALRALRELATGRPAERLNPPTHVREKPDPDAPRPTHYVHILDQVRLHRALPSPNHGKFGGAAM